MIKTALANLVPRSMYFAIAAHVAAKDIGSGRRWAPEIKFLAKFVDLGDTVIDVGGNHGLYTYHLSRLVGSSGRVHTFEPIPPNLRILRQTIVTHKLSNVAVHPQACGHFRAQAVFCVPLEHGMPELGGAWQGRDGLQFDCEIVRLEDIVAEEVTFLKIDVEGAELLVLRGAERILRNWHPVILLEAGDHCHRYGYKQQDVFDFLASFGYTFFNGRMEPREAFLEATDYFCIRNDDLPF